MKLLLLDYHDLLRLLLPILLVLTAVSADIIATVTANGANGSSAFAILKGTAIAVVADVCDNYGSFNCPTGTCYTGYDGFVGCCSASKCAARTACFPYDSKVSRSCNVDTDGCIACSSGAPACVTISNMVNSQYIMYCDSSSTKEILSYTNLITNGSMALPPMSRTASTTPPAAPTNSLSSSDIQSQVPATTTQTTVSATSNATQVNDFEVSRAAVAGITVGSIVGLTSIIFILGFLYRRRRISAEAAKDAESEKSPGPFDPSYSVGFPADTAISRRLQKPPTSRGGLVRDRMAVISSGGDEYSVSVGELLAREAEHRTAALFPHGINRSDYSPTSPTEIYPSPEIGQAMRRGDWRPTPPILAPHHRGQFDFRPHHTSSGVVQTEVAELPSTSIRYVQPSGSFSTPDLPSLATANFDPNPHSSTQVEAASSTYSNPISPNPSSFIATPFLRDVSPPTTPLMGRWAGDRSSVGQDITQGTSTSQSQSEKLHITQKPLDFNARNATTAPQDHGHDLARDQTSARVTGPLNWPSGMHIRNQSNGRYPIPQVDGTLTARFPNVTSKKSSLVQNGVKRNRDGSPRIESGKGTDIYGKPLRGTIERSLTTATGFRSGVSEGRGGYITAEAAMAGADLDADKEFAP